MNAPAATDAADDGALYHQLGRITRELHQAVRELQMDERLAQIARADMPDACSRLDHVVRLSEESAHRTLDLVEHGRSIGLRMHRVSQALGAACVDAYGVGTRMSPLLGAALEAQREIGECSEALRADLMAVAQAQEYQDLSGQVIRRVITLVRSVEGALLSLLQAAGSGSLSVPATLSAVPGGLQGPVAAGKGASQQDADALLAELGF